MHDAMAVCTHRVEVVDGGRGAALPGTDRFFVVGLNDIAPAGAIPLPKVNIAAGTCERRKPALELVYEC